jgi:hypothetical protein
VPDLPATAPIKALAIPAAGKYVVIAIVDVVDVDSSAVGVLCQLSAGGDYDQKNVSLTGNVTGDVGAQSVTLTVVHTYAAAGTAGIGRLASTAHAQLKYLKITAIAVGSLTNTGL